MKAYPWHAGDVVKLKRYVTISNTSQQIKGNSLLHRVGKL